jgi:hypothetical protein
VISGGGCASDPSLPPTSETHWLVFEAIEKALVRETRALKANPLREGGFDLERVGRDGGIRIRINCPSIPDFQEYVNLYVNNRVPAPGPV